MHHRRGYILVLLFGILSACMLLMSTFLSRIRYYQQLMHTLVQKNDATDLAYNAVQIGQGLLTVPSEKEKQEKSAKGSDEKSSDQIPYKTFLTHIFPALHTVGSFDVSKSCSDMKGILHLCIRSETGKININSLYDFRKKEFAYQGQAGDRRKFCQWLFEKISKITHKPSLFDVFEKYLKTRAQEFNDVVQLLEIPEFAQVFGSDVFFQIDAGAQKRLFLTDIFTVFTDKETINPWFFSHSWRILLDMTPKALTSEEQKKVVSSFKSTAHWDTDWQTSLKMLYQKEYADLPQEIKSLLTTECEANIFSLLLRATIGETIATIFVIVKKHMNEDSLPFDILKIYQI